METSHFIYMRKCDQLIGFRGTSNSEMAFLWWGPNGGLMGGKGNVRSPSGLLNLALSPYVSPVLWVEEARPEKRRCDILRP